MQFTVNHRLLKNNCILFLAGFFLFEFIYISFVKRYDNLSSDINFSQLTISSEKIDNNNNHLSKKIFRYLQPHYHSVSCQNLYEHDYNEFKHALALLSDLNNLTSVPDQHYNITKAQCSIYRSERFNEPYHHEDSFVNRQFPLAFTILMYENVEQFERLLHLIYRPQNFYCVHVDSDASANVLQAVKSIIQCFNNIFLASKQERVLYATFSRLQADLNCMQDLMKYPSWKYVLNVANTELPLKTNAELVKILSIYRGYNDIEGRWKTKNIERTEYVWQIFDTPTGNNQQVPQLRRTNEKKTSPPGNVEIVKGSAYGAFSRAFIEFVQTSPIAKELLDWSRDTYSPDEHYWATLNYNTHLNSPGGYKAKSDPTNWTARFVNWGEQNCYGRIIRGICVFGIFDLPNLLNRHELFANKFHLNADPIAYQCLEELILNKSKLDLPLNDAIFYRHMPFLLPS
ncbi:unnamed protein product [Rotaria socialis]|uniref:Uncharacterized protein n=1 Tax=Rotaria socialis TaxID=392032 RepID=A0A817ST42_9BILA|nr:unnamed protein product [Rotaria socialis]CAF3657628.1 unnamed protein product [Rotaria socialis]CAF4249277.1 unnamed protein product [Rotaria socialis]CAF4269423.1 unnamed protein product [Rotaria socialis]